MDEFTTGMALQAAGLILTDLYGAAKKGGKRALELFRGKCGEPSYDREQLARQLLDAASADTQLAAQLIELIDTTSAVTDTPWRVTGAPSPWRDRDAAARQVPASGVCVLSGRRGSGRTSFARRIAETRRTEFPRGCVEIDLNDNRIDEHMSLPGAKRRILRALGVVDIAEEWDELEEQFATVISLGRILLILRNVRGRDEITPFEPVPPGSLVLACTASLTGELRVKYSCVELEAMERDGAHQLLADRCGGEQLQREVAATTELLELCGYLPEPIEYAALSIQRRQGRPNPVASVVDRLRRKGFASVDDVLRDAIDETIAGMPAEVRGACLLLADCCPAGFDTATATAVLEPEFDDAVKLLDNMKDTHVLLQTGVDRYQLEHAVRVRVLETGTEPGNDVRIAAFVRLLDFLRDCALHGDMQDDPDRLRLFSLAYGQGRPPSGADPIAYLDAQWPALIEAVRRGHQLGLHERVCQLGGALEVWVNKRRRYEWYDSLNETVIRSVRQLLATAPDEEREQRTALCARAHAMQARVKYLAGDVPGGGEQFAEAWRLFGALPASRHRQLNSSMLEFHGRYEEIRAKQCRDETSVAPDFGAAIESLVAATRIDRDIDDARALLIHLRMLANVLVEAGRVEEAFPLLAEAKELRGAAGRNLARVYMVYAKALYQRGFVAEARHSSHTARAIIERDGSRRNYEWELGELEAELAHAAGDVEQARALWGGLAEDAMRAGMPRLQRYLDKLKELPQHRS